MFYMLITFVETFHFSHSTYCRAVTGKEFFSMPQWPFIIQNQCDILKTNVTFSNSNDLVFSYVCLSVIIMSMISGHTVTVTVNQSDS